MSGIGGASRQAHRPAGFVDNKIRCRIAAQHATDISHIVEQTRDYKVIVIRRFDALGHYSSAEDVATRGGHKHGMFEVMIQSVTAA